MGTNNNINTATAALERELELTKSVVKARRNFGPKFHGRILEAHKARTQDPLMITRDDAFKRNFPEGRFTLTIFEGVNLDLLRYDAEANVGYAVSFVTGQLYGFRVVGTKTYRRCMRRVAVYAAEDTGRADALLSFPERTTTGYVHEAVLTDGA